MSVFGNKINDFTNVAPNGATGYVVAIPLKANYLRTIYSIQMQDAANEFSEVITAKQSYAQLFGNLSASNPPDFAMYQAATTLYVYLKSSVYPYGATVHIGIAFDRDVVPLATVDDYVDVRSDKMNLFKAYLLKRAIELQGKRVEFDITQNIIRQKAALRLS